jgi:hypothetical protein
MRTHPLNLPIAVLVALIAVWPRVALAQSTVDSSKVVPHSKHPIAAWASVGLGPGQVRGSGSGAVADEIRANVAVGSLLFTYRSSDAGPFIGSGDGVRDDAALVGVLAGGRRLFASASLGYARAAHYHQCDGCGRGLVDPGVGVLAFDVTGHANYIVPGIAVSFSGNIGPSRVAYSALTFALELGWFGK